MISSDVNTDDLAAFLDSAWNAAGAAANTLPQQLQIQQQAALQLISTGSVASVGKNSAHQSMGGYSPGNLTQRQITAIYTTLIRFYQVVLDKINAAGVRDGVEFPNGYDFDPPVYAILTQFLQSSAMEESRGDITNLNLPRIGRVTEGIFSW
jgi:hypothetical protein